MAITRISSSEFTIDTPGFEDRIYGEDSYACLAQPAAIKFCENYGPGFRMPTADEVIAFRRAAFGLLEETNESNRVATIFERMAFLEAKKYHITGTTVLYLKINDVWHMAFDDNPGGFVVQQAQTGFDLHKVSRRWTRPIYDGDIRAALKRAEKNNRIVPVVIPDNDRWFGDVLSTALCADGTSEYGQNTGVKAALPCTSEINAQILRLANQESGCFAYATNFDGVPKNHVEIRRLGVSGDEGHYGLLLADGLLRYVGCGHIRPVRIKNA